MSSIGIIWEWPPPVAPPFRPKTGPKEGSLKTAIVFLPRAFKPSHNPMEIVVFPSPYGVGLILVTKIKSPSWFVGLSLVILAI